MRAVSKSEALTDPVCGMLVDADSPYRFAHGRSLFCLCSARCLDLFIADPKRFGVIAAANAASGLSSAAHYGCEQISAPTQPVATRPPDKAPRWLTGTAWRGLLAGLGPWRERRFARCVARELVELYRTVSARHPHLRGRDLYREIVIARKRIDPDSANALLDEAEESYATWPILRALTFCDVVHFIAVSEFLASHGDAAWIQADMRREVKSQIPRNL
ncbi:MAG: YHS domain-containing protein [Betaproteobacteria bacterium]|nr:MAG: YHS domain-containing protein [Betaproteobacteria bacterium]